MINQDAPHHGGDNAEELAAIEPVGLMLHDELQVQGVNQLGRVD